MSAHPIACPCCRQTVRVPNVDLVIDVFGLTPMEGSVLRAIWRGNGQAVMPSRIFDLMYQGDPDGGPGQQLMYKAFKVALCRLRSKLKASGISVENLGYRQGYRLILDAGEVQPSRRRA